MNSILIKPHHFIDIIKLYGSGIDRFVPDEKMGHDFYKVANEIIDNPSVDLKLTIDGDDICKPCKKYHEQCIDPLTHIQYIFEVWDEEDNEVTQKRYELFLQGAHKFLDNI